VRADSAVGRLRIHPHRVRVGAQSDLAAREQTQLGTFSDDFASADRSLSGVRLIRNPREAFHALFASAALAEKSLDLQNYL